MLTAWIGAFLAIAVVAFLLGGRGQFISATEARARIAALEDSPDFERMFFRRFHVDEVLGSRTENRLRDWLHIDQRERPCVIEDYQFRGPSGPFTVQLWDWEGKSAKIKVFGGPEAATSSGQLLRSTFPEADYVGKP